MSNKEDNFQYDKYNLYHQFLPIAFLMVFITCFLYSEFLTISKNFPLNIHIFSFISAIISTAFGYFIFKLFRKRFEEKVLRKNTKFKSKMQYYLFFALYVFIGIIIGIAFLLYAYFI